VRRFPGLTLVVAVVTTAGLVVQELVPGTLGNLERSPAAWHGDWWRWVTSLLVQDGHLGGGVFNIAGLLLCGVAAEQVVRRAVWLFAYLGAGLTGQLFGHWWQPVGGGNSVAVCGLAAVLVVHLLRSPSPPFGLATWAAVLWCATLAAGLWAPLPIAGVLVAMLAAGPLAGHRWTRYVAGAFCCGCAVALLVDQDLHGGALTVSLIVAGAAALTGAGARPAAVVAEPGR
jgi:membrane associated rhomboid family serine protease